MSNLFSVARVQFNKRSVPHATWGRRVYVGRNGFAVLKKPVGFQYVGTIVQVPGADGFGEIRLR